MASTIPSKLLLLLLSPSSSSSPTPPPSLLLPSAYSPDRSAPLRYSLFLALNAFLFLLRLVVSLALSITGISLGKASTAENHGPLSYKNLGGPARLPAADVTTPGREGDTCIGRALSNVLSSMTRIPVWSRKYEVVRDLAERLIDDNLRCGSACLGAVNRAVLSAAFARTSSRVEAAVAARVRAGRKADGSVERIIGGVRSRLRLWADEAEEGEKGAVGVSDEAVVKMAAELLWLAEKMAVCGAVGEAVALWGSASELARLSLAAEPRLQGAIVKVSVFLFKHAKEMEVGNGHEQLATMASCQMTMLMSWLPLLCRASNGTDAPILSSLERAETVKVLEEMIQKLSRDQQEEVLIVWLHHFTSSSHSDWPNLQSSYIHWYHESRKLLQD